MDLGKSIELDRNFNHKKFSDIERNFSIFLRQKGKDYEKGIDFELAYSHNKQSYIIKIKSTQKESILPDWLSNYSEDRGKNNLNKFCIRNNIGYVMLKSVL